MKNKKIVFVVIAVLLVFSVCVIGLNNNSENIKTVNAEVLSNKKIGWGIKRSNSDEQPDVGTTNKEILDANNGLCLGNKEKKYIYLTFDEGYEAGYTEQILNVLKENNVKAAFFITAHFLNTQPNLVKRMIDEGHIVGNHTVNHKSMPELSDEEIEKEVMDLHTAIYQKFGYEMTYIRPPMGEFSQRTLAICNNLGYKTVMWSFAHVDWDENKQPDSEKSKELIMKNLHNGEIMLLHGNSKTNTDILGDIIKEIKNKGYEFKSLDEFQK